MAAKQPTKSGGTIRSYEEYLARFFPNEVERQRLASHDPSILGKAIADRAIEDARVHIDRLRSDLVNSGIAPRQQ